MPLSLVVRWHLGAVPNSDEPGLPRWVQILAGLVLLPLAALSVVGSISIFGIPKVQADPLLQLLAGAIVLLCLWASSLAVRLLLGLKGRRGLFGPTALRVIAVVAIALVAGGFFTGIYATHPVRSVALSISYVLIAWRLWQMAARRAEMPTKRRLRFEQAVYTLRLCSSSGMSGSVRPI